MEDVRSMWAFGDNLWGFNPLTTYNCTLNNLFGYSGVTITDSFRQFGVFPSSRDSNRIVLSWREPDWNWIFPTGTASTGSPSYVRTREAVIRIGETGIPYDAASYGRVYPTYITYAEFADGSRTAVPDGMPYDSYLDLSNLSSELVDFYMEITGYSATYTLSGRPTTESYTFNTAVKIRTFKGWNDLCTAIGAPFQAIHPQSILVQPEIICNGNTRQLPLDTISRDEFIRIVADATVPNFTTTFTDTDHDNTVNLGDRSTGDLVDIVCNFPDGVVNNRFIYNPDGLNDAETVCIFPDPDNNQMRIRIRTTGDDLDFGYFNIAFSFNENVPNYRVRLFYI